MKSTLNNLDMTCSALHKVAKDFSLVMQGFKMGDGLKI